MASRSVLLQRKCACGGTTGPTRECEACRKKRLQRNNPNIGFETQNDSMVPSIVHEVLRTLVSRLIAEGILTGGAGVADDPAIIRLATMVIRIA